MDTAPIFPMPSANWGEVTSICIFDAGETWRHHMQMARRYYRAGMFPPNRFTIGRFRGKHYSPL